MRDARKTPEPAPARLGDQQAVALLEAKGLARRESSFVLNSESVATSRLVSLRSRAVALNQADARLAEISQALTYLRELDQAIININGQIAQLNAAMAQFPATWARGRWFHGMNNLENDAYEGFKAQKIECERVRGAELVPQRDTLRANQPGRQKGEATENLKRCRYAAVTALSDLQEAVASTRKGYTDLGNNPEVKRALAGIGGVELGPSREFLQVEQECQKFERSAAQLKLATRP